MSGLDSLFADLWSGLAPQTDADFQAFPGPENADLERQAADKKGFSSISSVSSAKNEGVGIPMARKPQARAGGRGGVGAREPAANRLEILETLEKPLPSEACLSSSLSRNLEIKGGSGNLSGPV